MPMNVYDIRLTTDEKKFFLLLKAVIFYYHGLDEDERLMLEETASQIDGKEEMKWAVSFVSKDYLNSFERAREYLKPQMKTIDKKKSVAFLWDVWQANDKKGYTTEMEASAMIRLARDWGIDYEIRDLIRKEYKFF